nr:hypothetical protein [uncultured Clostridium sp.]
MAFKYESGIPKGCIIPVYLTEDGDVYPIFFHSMEELELCGEMVAMVLNHTVAVDNKHTINSPEDKISVIDLTKKKN